MTNASGAPVTVYLDKDLNVVSVDTTTHDGGRPARRRAARMGAVRAATRRPSPATR